MINLQNQIISIVNEFNKINKNTAYSKLQVLLKQNPNHLELNNVNYQFAVNLNLIDEAISSLLICIKLRPKEIKFFLNLYPLFIKKQNYEKAIYFINKIIKLNKNANNVVIRDKGYVYYLQNKFNEANKLIEKSLLHDDSDFFTLNIKGLLLSKENSFSKAIDYFSKAIKINPKYTDSYNNLGNCYYELEDFDKSFKYFKKSYSLNKSDVSSIINISNILSLKNKYNSSINLLKKVLKVDPNNKKALFNLCICFFRIKDEKNAKKYFNQLIKIDPDNNDLKYTFSTFCLSIFDFDNAWKYFDARINTEKSHKSFKNLNLVNYKNIDTESFNPNKKILILREQGIGEEILFSSIYPDILKNFNNISIEADKRLINLFNNSFDKNVFYPEGYYSDNKINLDFDYIIYAGSFLKQFRKNKKYFSNKNYLIPDEKITKDIKNQLFDYRKKTKIGISWKSVLNIFGKLKSLNLNDFLPIFNNNRIIINLQYGNVLNEINDFNQNKHELFHFNNIDLFNDIDSCASLLSNLDVFVTVSNSTAHIAGAIGIPTILICPSKSTTYYYWNAENENSIWYKNIKVISLDESISKTFLKINKFISQYENF